MKPTLKTIALSVMLIAASLTMLLPTTSQAQTYKAAFSTKLVLPSAGNDPTNVFTIVSGTLTGPLSWTLPTTAGSSGNVLSTDGSGHLSWVPATSTVTLGGDVTGPSGSNLIATTAGGDIVAAINSTGGAGGINGSQVNPAFGTQNISTTGTIGGGAITGTSLTASGGGTITTTGTVSGGTGTFTTLSATTMGGALAMGGNDITGGGAITGTAITGTSLTAGSGTISTTGAVDGGTGVFTSTLSAVGLTSTGGFTTSGGTANINTAGNDPVNIGTSNSGAGGAITIGDNAGPSITNLNGTVNFGGTVTLPSGSVTASSIGLTTNDLMVGVGGNGSALPTANNGVLVTDGSGVPSISSSLPSGLTIPGATISNPTITGTVTLPANSVSNADLQNSSLTVTAGSGLSGGGPVALGGTTTVSLDVTHPNTWTGAQTFGNTGFTSAADTISAPTNNWTLNPNSSYFLVSATGGAQTVTGITARAGGSIIVLVNTSSNAITLSNGNGASQPANQFHFQGASDLLVAQDGTVTLIYDATYNAGQGAWRMISAQ